MIVLFAAATWAAPAPAPIEITSLGDIYGALPPKGATKWDPAPLIAGIRASTVVFTPKDVYDLIDHEVRPDVVTPVAQKAAVFYDPQAMVSLDAQKKKARANAMSQDIALDPSTFVQLFEFFSDRENDLQGAIARVGTLQPQGPTESQGLYEKRARTHAEQLIKAKGPYEGRIEKTTFTVTLTAAVEERDGCSRAIAKWDAAAVSFDLFRSSMGTTKAPSAQVALTNSPTIEKAWFATDPPGRRFEIVGRCGTTGRTARITMTRTAEGAWSGSAAL